MPQMADITVKKADGVTNIVYSALTPSSGDKTAAQWRSETAGAAAALRPTFQLSSQWNGPRTARRVDFVYQYPFTVTDSTTTVTSVKARIPFSGTMTLPAEIPDTVVAEAVAQAGNLLVSTLIQSSLKAGYAPT
jgi:hypothetical protein